MDSNTTPLLLRLPFELRLHIWKFVQGPIQVEPCKCPSKPGTCPSNHTAGCCQAFDAANTFDYRISRVCRQIHREFHDLLLRSPKTFVVCNGLCLESLFLGIKARDRRWIKNVKVNLYVGDVSWETLSRHSDQALLRAAESACGSFVGGALKCQRVGSLVKVTPLGEIVQDDIGRRTLCVDLTLA